MEYRRLGARGPTVSAIGFGAWAIGGHGYGKVDDTESIRAISRALDLGITLFDTADVYGFGHSEHILGRALANRGADVVIATKFGVAWDANGNTRRDATPVYARQALEASLRRLRTDCIDLFQIHWPDGRTPLAETIGMLEICRKEGLIRHIGVSNFVAQDVVRSGAVEQLTSAQCRFNLIDTAAETDMRELIKLGLGTIAYSVLARGLLSGKFSTQLEFDVGDTRDRDPLFSGERFKFASEFSDALQKVAVSHRCTAAQVAIRWTVSHPAVTCALVGAKNVDQTTDNAMALQVRLTADEWQQIATTDVLA